ncbi:MAG: hypothetical protein WC308_02335 [archaeon]|jgi:hypothetical protein
MSLYGPKISLPEMPKIPEINMENLKGPAIAMGAIIIAIIILFIIFSLLETQSGNIFSESIRVEWANNPLDLTKENANEALLKLTLTNITTNSLDIHAELDTNSEEILIYPTQASFSNVAPGDYRKTSFIVKANPNKTIFSGSYTISIKTNLGEKKVKLEVIAQ